MVINVPDPYNLAAGKYVIFIYTWEIRHIHVLQLARLSQFYCLVLMSDFQRQKMVKIIAGIVHCGSFSILSKTSQNFTNAISIEFISEQNPEKQECLCYC